jgi:hypothetical protein
MSWEDMQGSSHDLTEVTIRVMVNPLMTKHRLLYLTTQFLPHSKHFSSRLQKPIYVVSGTSHRLF